VSLILEALKKLERERKAPERGFLVTTSAAWPARGGSGALYLLGGVLLVAAGAALAWLLLGTERQRQTAAGAPMRPPPSLAPSPPSPTPLAPLVIPTPAPAPPPARPAIPRPTAAPPVPTPAPEPTPNAELRLEAVSQRDGQPVAVVSGRLVHEGDAFDNVRIIRIGSAEVEIEVDGQRRVLSF
jgi:hypothetical protein